MKLLYVRSDTSPDIISPYLYMYLGDAWKMLLDTAEAMTSDFDPEARVSLDKFADQLPNVFNQVTK